MRLGYILCFVAALFSSQGAIAASARGPAGQQAQCAASGGTFSMGYEADTYICVTGAGRTVQTCRYGKSDTSCSTEDGPSHKAGGRSEASAMPSSR